MPRNTVSESRGRNMYGHNSKSDKDKVVRFRNRTSSPPRKMKIGNGSKLNCCSFCNPEIAKMINNRVTLRQHKTDCKQNIKKSDLYFDFILID